VTQRFQKNDWEDAPSREKSLPQRMWREGGGISYRPLYRYLSSMVGQPWADIHARIPEKLRGELHWLIRSDVMEIAPERFTVPNGYYSMWGFFIKQGVLRRLPEHQWKKQRRKKLPPNMKEIHDKWDYKKVLAVEISLDGETYVKRPDENEFWFRKVLTGYRPIRKWDTLLKKYVTVGKEPVFNLLQVTGKLQKQLDEAWRRKSVA